MIKNRWNSTIKRKITKAVDVPSIAVTPTTSIRVYELTFAASTPSSASLNTSGVESEGWLLFLY
jgi:hypothetical protein